MPQSVEEKKQQQWTNKGIKREQAARNKEKAEYEKI